LQAEAELAQQTPGRIAPSSTTGSPVIIPRLPHNPTRVDRLYVESLREHSKVCLGKSCSSAQNIIITVLLNVTYNIFGFKQWDCGRLLKRFSICVVDFCKLTFL